MIRSEIAREISADYYIACLSDDLKVNPGLFNNGPGANALTLSTIYLADKAPVEDNTIAHELGHAMGLSHVPLANQDNPGSADVEYVHNVMYDGVQTAHGVRVIQGNLNPFQCRFTNLTPGSWRNVQARKYDGSFFD